MDENENVETVEGVVEEEQPMNVFERSNLLDGQDTKQTKGKQDKLWDEIKGMSDEELKEAVVNEPVTINEVEQPNIIEAISNEASKVVKEEYQRVVNSLMLNDLDEHELMQLYQVAIKSKTQRDFNLLAALPKKIYDNIIINCRNMRVSRDAVGIYAKMLVDQLLEDKELEDMCKEFMSEFDSAMTFPEITDMYSEHIRDKIEKGFIGIAEQTENPVEKQIMLDSAQAYTDSYTLVRQLKLLEDDLFIKRLAKKIRRYERGCDDFDWVMSKSVVHTYSIRAVIELLPRVIQINENQAKAFVVMLTEVCKNITPEDKPGIWFMYSSVSNIVNLSRTSHTKTAFSKECMDHLKNLFVVLDKRHTEVFGV